MPASHSNGPPTCTLRHPASWASPNGSDTLLGLPWISGPWSYLVWSFKWVLRYSPSETKIVCASCAESFGQPCQTCHPCFWMDKSQMENKPTVTVLPGSVLLCPEPVPGLLGWAYPEQLGLSSTACGLVLGNSICPCTNGVSLLPNCECGASEQTADHVLTACPIHWAPHGARVWQFWMTKFNAGLITSLPASDSGSSAVWGSKRINPRPQFCLCLTWVDILQTTTTTSGQKTLFILLKLVKSWSLHKVSRKAEILDMYSM